MWTHLMRLLANSWQEALHSGSSSGISVFYLSGGTIVLTFVFTLLFEWKKGGSTMNSFKHAGKSWPLLVIPMSSLAILWAGLFGWSVVQTIYGDHTSLVTQNERLRAKLQKTSPDAIRAAIEELSIDYEQSHGYPHNSLSRMPVDEVNWITHQLVSRGYSVAVFIVKTTPVPIFKGFDIQNSPGSTFINPSVNLNSNPNKSK